MIFESIEILANAADEKARQNGVSVEVSTPRLEHDPLLLKYASCARRGLSPDEKRTHLDYLCAVVRARSEMVDKNVEWPRTAVARDRQVKIADQPPLSLFSPL